MVSYVSRKKDGTVQPCATTIDYVISNVEALTRIVDLEVKMDWKSAFGTEHAPVRTATQIDKDAGYGQTDESKWRQLPKNNKRTIRLVVEENNLDLFRERTEGSGAIEQVIEVIEETENDGIKWTNRGISEIYKMVEATLSKAAKKTFIWRCNGIMKQPGGIQDINPEEEKAIEKKEEKKQERKSKYIITDDQRATRMRERLALSCHDQEFQQLGFEFLVAQTRFNSRRHMIRGDPGIPILAGEMRRVHRLLNKRRNHLMIEHKVFEV